MTALDGNDVTQNRTGQIYISEQVHHLMFDKLVLDTRFIFDDLSFGDDERILIGGPLSQPHVQKGLYLLFQAEGPGLIEVILDFPVEDDIHVFGIDERVIVLKRI